MNQEECLRVLSPITILNTQNNLLLYMPLHGVKIYNKECSLIQTISHEVLNFKITTAQLNKDATQLLCGAENKIYIFDLLSGTLIKNFTINATVEKLFFDESSNYFFVITDDSRIYKYRSDSSTQISRLLSFRKKAQTFTLIVNQQLLIASANKTLAFINHQTKEQKTFLELADTITFLKIIAPNLLFCATQEGFFYLIDITTKKILKQITSKLSSVFTFTPITNSSYALVAAKDDLYLSLFDMKQQKIVNHHYIKLSAKPTALTFDTNKLFIATSSLELLYINFETLFKEFEHFVNHNQLQEAFELLEQHPFLDDTNLQKAFNAKIQEIIDLFTHNNTTQAKKILQKELAIAQKQQELTLLERSFKNYNQFKTLVLEKKYPLAYGMSEKYPYLKQTPQYIKMEQAWQKTFADAQRQMILGQLQIAREILNSYITTLSKRSFIKFVLKYNKEFISFLKAIKRKDFSTIAQLVSLHEMFEQTPNYIQLKQQMQELFNSTQIKLQNLEDITQELEQLKDVSFLQNEVRQLQNNAQDVKKLQQAYENNNFTKCYTLLDTHPFLETTQLGTLLQKHWQKTVTKAEEKAIRGDFKGVKESFGELLFTPTRKAVVGDLLRLSYRIKIKLLLAKKSYKKAEAVLYAYGDIFGEDKELKQLKKIFEHKSKTKLALQYEKPSIGRDDWLNLLH